MSGAYRQALPWLIWGIRKPRNGKNYAGNAHDADILVVQALDEAEWKMANKEESGTDSISCNAVCKRQVWSKPRSVVLKCNVNVSWINSSQLCGRSWIVRDHNGEVHFHARDAFLPAHNKIVVELRGIL